MERPALLDQPIVDSSENHLVTVFPKLVVDKWFDLQRTDDTPLSPAQPQAGKAPAFRITYVMVDGADAARIRLFDPHPDEEMTDPAWICRTCKSELAGFKR